jgi:hypothetical protein
LAQPFPKVDFPKVDFPKVEKVEKVEIYIYNS